MNKLKYENLNEYEEKFNGATSVKTLRTKKPELEEDPDLNIFVYNNLNLRSNKDLEWVFIQIYSTSEVIINEDSSADYFGEIKFPLLMFNRRYAWFKNYLSLPIRDSITRKQIGKINVLMKITPKDEQLALNTNDMLTATILVNNYSNYKEYCFKSFNKIFIDKINSYMRTELVELTDLPKEYISKIFFNSKHEIMECKYYELYEKIQELVSNIQVRPLKAILLSEIYGYKSCNHFCYYILFYIINEIMGLFLEAE